MIKIQDINNDKGKDTDMASIEGVNLPHNKRIEYALPYIYGIGLKAAQDILTKVGVHFDIRVKDLTDAEVAVIQQEISKNYVVEGELRKEMRQNISRLQEIGTIVVFGIKKVFRCVVNVLKQMREHVKVLRSNQLH